MLLTVRDAAKLLKTSERQLYRWVNEEEIPFQRVREQIRFNRTELLEWAAARRLPVALEAFDADEDPGERAPSLGAALRAGGVHVGVSAADREGALRAVVEKTPVPPSVDRELLVELLIARETTSSTAIGEGIAIPHVRHPVVAPGAPEIVTLCHLATPVPFGAPDGKPVGVVFMIVSPTVRTHLKMLAHLAHALSDPGFRAALDRAAPLEDMVREADRIEAHAAAAASTPRRDDGGGGE
jgi:PTS system nitrogen regulatory IIA component